MFHIVLHQPEIPPNTGNVIRLCANTGASLHLVEPLGFQLDDRQLKRAGLDYHEYARLQVHPTLDAALGAIDALEASVDVEGRDEVPGADGSPDGPQAMRVFAFSTRGTVRYDRPRYRTGDVFVFGSETRGLPAEVIESLPAGQRLRMPMRPGNRSLNLSNAVAVVAYEAWRQLGFAGGA